MATHSEETFEGMTGAMHVGDVFEGCTFKGEAKDSNLADAVFTDCIFEDGFAFIHCNLLNAAGIENVPKQDCAYMSPNAWAQLEFMRAANPAMRFLQRKRE
jgi:hypothetical protein